MVLAKTDLDVLIMIEETCPISNATLASELGMSPSGILEHEIKLEQNIVIQQYTARINPTALQQKMLTF